MKRKTVYVVRENGMDRPRYYDGVGNYVNDWHEACHFCQKADARRIAKAHGGDVDDFDDPSEYLKEVNDVQRK